MTWTNLEKVSVADQVLATEALDFLMTEDNNYILVREGSAWGLIAKVVSNWTNI